MGRKNKSEISKRKVMGIAGISFEIIMIILLVCKVTIPLPTIPFAMGERTYNLNLTPIIWWIGLFPSAFLALKLFEGPENTDGTGFKSGKRAAPGNAEQIKILSFRSIPYSRIAVIVILGISAYLQLKRWGPALISEEIEGNWFALGGPSLFWPTAAPTIPIIVGLIIYSLGAVKKIEFDEITCGSEGDTDRNAAVGGDKSGIRGKKDAIQPVLLEVSEKRILFGHSKSRTLDLGAITYFRLSNIAHPGQFLWLLLPVHAFLLIDDALAFYLNPHTFGLGYTTANYYLFQGIVELICFALLFLLNNFSLILQTGEITIILNFAGRKNAAAISDYLEKSVGLYSVNIDSDTDNGKKSADEIVPSKISRPRFPNIMDLTALFAAFVLVFSRLSKYYLGQETQLLVWVWLAMYSVISIPRMVLNDRPHGVKAIKYDTPSGTGMEKAGLRHKLAPVLLIFRRDSIKKIDYFAYPANFIFIMMIHLLLIAFILRTFISIWIFDGFTQGPGSGGIAAMIAVNAIFTAIAVYFFGKTSVLLLKSAGLAGTGSSAGK